MTFKVLSWGAGVQSTALGEMSISGDFELPLLDVIGHSNTGWERRATYETVEFYSRRWRKMGVHVEVVTAGDIRELGAKDHVHIPFWTSIGGPLNRQCSRHFKIDPLKRLARRLAGYHERRPPHPPAASIEKWIGFSWDEWDRASISKRDPKFIVIRWPLLDLKLTRQDCVDYLEAKGLPVPIKSSCIGCPYRQATEWLDMKQNSPAEFAEAVAFDELNRHNPLGRLANSTADALYIYNNAQGSDRVRPLATADLEADAERERCKRKGFQAPLMLCAAGECGT